MFLSRPGLRVLFVCTANICRSPLAQALLRYRLRNIGLATRVRVRSAGTSALRAHRPDPRVLQLAAEAGVAVGRIRSRPLTREMIRSSDLVLVMERSQLEAVGRLCTDPGAGSGDSSGVAPGIPGHESGPENVRLLGEFLPPAGIGQIPEIPDPYFSDLQGFREVHDLIDLAVIGLAEHIASRLSRHLPSA